MGHIYLLVMDKLLTDFAWVQAIQAAAAFGWPAGILRLEAVIYETPLNTCRTKKYSTLMKVTQDWQTTKELIPIDLAEFEDYLNVLRQTSLAYSAVWL